MCEKANKHEVFVGKSERNRPIKDLGIDGVIILKLIFVLSTSCFKISFHSVFQNNICW
jgi:hypothetical protein